MPKLLYCLAQGLAKLDRSEVAAAVLDPTGLAGCLVMGKVVAGFWKEWRGERQQEDLHAEVVEVARLEHAKLAAAVADALDLPHLDPDRKKLIETVLTLTPAVVRRTLTRPEDPSGKSVPYGLRLDTPDDLARLLPATLPRFHAGGAVPNLGDWELVRLLGAGGFGEVWLARNPLSPRFVGAVKFFFGAMAEHVRHEANLVARLTDAADHPNIVPLRNSSLRGDTPWLLYEYVEGTTLTPWVHAQHAAAPAERQAAAVAALRDILAAVAFGHGLTPPIVHRDLKPDNVLWDRGNDRFRVTDYGIGAAAGGRAVGTGRLATGLRGSHTPDYASPQQKARGDADPSDDVYALGVIAYQMLTSQTVAGPGGTAARRLKALGVTDGLIDLVIDSASEVAEDRPADAQAMAQRLDACFPRPAQAAEVVAEPLVELRTAPLAENQWEVGVPGMWEAGCVNDFKTEFHWITDWCDVCQVPSIVTVKPYFKYGLSVGPRVTDSDLVPLAKLIRLESLVSLRLYMCHNITDSGLVLRCS